MNSAVLNYLLFYSQNGFMLWSFFWIVARHYKWKAYFSFDRIDKIVVKIIAVIAIANLLYLIFEFLFARHSLLSVERYAFMLGPYWFAYWIMSFTSLLLPQIFWIEKVRRSVRFRALATLWMFCVLNFERFMIIITSFHRDYTS